MVFTVLISLSAASVVVVVVAGGGGSNGADGDAVLLMGSTHLFAKYSCCCCCCCCCFYFANFFLPLTVHLLLPTAAQTTADTLDKREDDAEEEDDDDDEGDGVQTVGETVCAVDAVDVQGLRHVHHHLGGVALRAAPEVGDGLGAVATSQRGAASALALVAEHLRLNGVQRVDHRGAGVVLLGVLQRTGQGVQGGVRIVDDAALGEADQTEDEGHADQAEQAHHFLNTCGAGGGGHL